MIEIAIATIAAASAAAAILLLVRAAVALRAAEVEAERAMELASAASSLAMRASAAAARASAICSAAEELARSRSSPGALDDQLRTYRELLPEIKDKHGLVWVLISGGRLVSTFSEFAAAATYASEHFPDDQVLIRHTSEQREFVPFIVVNGEVGLMGPALKFGAKHATL